MDYQNKYNEAYEKEYNVLFDIIRATLEKEVDKLLTLRFNDCKIAISGQHFQYGSDPYVKVLFEDYDRYNSSYSPKSVTTFVAVKFPETKKRYIEQGTNSKYLELDDKGTVELIARRDAFKKVYTAIDNTSISGTETIEEVLKLIRDYTPRNEEILPPQIKKTGKTFTESRQVLTIYYMLKALGINKFNTKADIGRIIHLITGEDIPVVEGKEILDNSIIYKRLKTLLNPKRGERNHEDLKFIKSLFENLKNSGTKGIQEIIQTINKDLAK